MLASSGSVGTSTWKGGWDPVRLLRKCTDACYIDLQCGSMPYWRQVVSSRVSYAFETRLECLQQMAHTIQTLPASLHIVPCSCKGLLLSDIVPTGIAAVVVGRRTMLPAGSCSEYYYMCTRSEPATHTDGFLANFTNTRWKLHASTKDHEQAACHAHKMLGAM